jgi:hypothetical protein
MVKGFNVGYILSLEDMDTALEYISNKELYDTELYKIKAKRLKQTPLQKINIVKTLLTHDADGVRIALNLYQI